MGERVAEVPRLVKRYYLTYYVVHQLSALSNSSKSLLQEVGCLNSSPDLRYTDYSCKNILTAKCVPRALEQCVVTSWMLIRGIPFHRKASKLQRLYPPHLATSAGNPWLAFIPLLVSMETQQFTFSPNSKPWLFLTVEL